VLCAQTSARISVGAQVSCARQCPYTYLFVINALYRFKICSLNKVQLDNTSHGPAVTLKIQCKIGALTGISVDFAPVVPTHIPLSSHIYWPRSKHWPPNNKVQACIQCGCNATAKKPFYWLDSYAECEEILMDGIDNDGGCRKMALRIMKTLREDIWRHKSHKPVISSYHLKVGNYWTNSKDLCH
jgi:hypothetical protein